MEESAWFESESILLQWKSMEQTTSKEKYKILHEIYFYLLHK